MAAPARDAPTPAPAKQGPGSEGALRLSRGDALTFEQRARFEPRVGASLAEVRLHTDAPAAAHAAALGAAAVTEGHDIYFAGGAYAPRAAGGLDLLAHELAHAAQFRPGGPIIDAARLEADANRTAAAIRFGGSAPVREHAGGSTAPLRQVPQGQAAREPEVPPGWQSPPNTLLFVQLPDRVAILPAAGLAYIPTPETMRGLGAQRPFVDRDLGALLEVAAVGAAGTRVVRIGERTAMLLDAGSDTRNVPVLVYTAQLQGVLSNMGVTDVSEIRILHVHADHVSRIVDALRANPSARVFIPAPYLAGTVHAALQRALNAVRADPAFGPTWNPVSAARDRGGPELASIRFSQGNVTIEQVALRSALANVRGQPDLSSYLTRVTRRTDNARVVVLGDLRMNDLSQFRAAMERQRPGAWNAFFENASLSGFSHHAGAFGAADVAGLMELLDATMFRTGRLRVVEQVNLTNAPANEIRNRTDTIDLMRRLGIDLVYTEMPTAASPPSGAGVTRDTTYARGAAPTIPTTPIASAQTAGVARLRRLIEARATMQAWRPIVDMRSEEARTAVDAELASVNASIATLTQALRTSAQAMATVRGQPAGPPGTARDYTATGGAAGQASAAALAAVPTTTPAETTLGEAGFRALEELRARNVEEVPLRVALHRAFTEGVYSEQAFRYMLTQIDPATRDSMLYGPRGGRRPNEVVFERLRAQYGFQSSVLPDGHTMSLRGFSPAGRVGARGVAWVMIAAEVLNLGAEVYRSVQLSRSAAFQRNLMPFLRRLAFWQQLGVQPAIVGVADPTFGSPTYEQNYDAVAQGLSTQRWQGLYIQHTGATPAISDAAIIRLGLFLTNYVRNYDEYATLFEDSHQDALRWRLPAGVTAWQDAIWEVHTGRYETSGENHVVDGIWVELPRLTQLMRVFIRRIIANTEAGIRQLGTGSAPAATDATSAIGGFGVDRPPPNARRMRFHPNAVRTRVAVLASGERGWNANYTSQLDRDINWASPPVFYLHSTGSDGFATVSGADFNTFSAIRDQSTLRYSTVMGGNDLNRPVQEQIGNTRGVIAVRMADLEPVP